MQAISEEKLKKWQLLLEEREKSKLTISEFCRQKNISPARFYYYQGLIKYPDKLHEPKTIKKPQQKQAVEIKPIKIIRDIGAKENTPIRLILPNSMQCILPRDISLHEMKAIVEILLAC